MQWIFACPIQAHSEIVTSTPDLDVTKVKIARSDTYSHSAVTSASPITELKQLIFTDELMPLPSWCLESMSLLSLGRPRTPALN